MLDGGGGCERIGNCKAARFMRGLSVSQPSEKRQSYSRPRAVYFQADYARLQVGLFRPVITTEPITKQVLNRESSQPPPP